MKYLKKSLFLLFLGITVNSFGQAAILALIFGDKVASEEFNISLEIGGGFNNYSNLDNSEFGGVAINFGIAGNIKLGERFYFSPTAYFLAKRQAEITSLSLDSGDPSLDAFFTDVPTSIQFSYTEVPLIFSYASKSGAWRYSTGVQLSFRGKVDAIFQNEEGTFTENYKPYVNSFNYGPIAEVAYNFQKIRKGKGAIVRMRYYYGVNDVFNSSFKNTNVKDSGVYVMLSFPFVTDAIAAKNLQRLNK